MINTERLILRDIKQEDAENIFVYRSDVESNLYQPGIPETLENVHDFIGAIPEKFNKENTWYQIVIERKEDGQIIGDLGLHFVGPNNAQVELGITLNQQYWRMGYAKEVFKKMINYLFHDLKKHRIYASVDPRNIGSMKLMKSVGLRQEAHFKKSYLLNDEWCDDVIFAILKEEWPNT